LAYENFRKYPRSFAGFIGVIFCGKALQAQKEILLKLQKDRGKKFNIAYMDATKPEDQKAFYDYGVRGLPSLALVDSRGKIAKIFTPGIQSYDAVA
jgi:hypothetical protein